MLKQKNRAKNIISFWITENLNANKWLYFVLCLICVLFLVLGFVVGFGKAGDFSLSDLPDGTLFGFLSKNISGATLFFSRFFAFLGLLVFVLLVCSKKFLAWICFAVVAYQSFLLAINASILISIYKLGGVISVLLVYFPLRLLMLAVMIVFSAVCFRCCLCQKSLGISVFSAEFFKKTKIMLILCLCLGFCSCFFEAILLPCVSNALLVSS